MPSLLQAVGLATVFQKSYSILAFFGVDGPSTALLLVGLGEPGTWKFKKTRKDFLEN